MVRCLSHEPGAEQTEPGGTEACDPNSGENIEGCGTAEACPQGGYIAGDQLNRCSIQNDEPAKLVIGDVRVPGIHQSAGSFDSHGGCGVSKPQKVGTDISAEIFQQYGVLFCGGEQAVQKGHLMQVQRRIPHSSAGSVL